MARHLRTVHHPRGVPGLEQVGHDVRSGTLPLGEHAHDGVEICWLARGAVTWLAGRRRLHLVGGTVSVVGAGVPHRGDLDVIAPSDLYWAVLRPGELLPLPDRAALRALRVRRAWTAQAPEKVGQSFASLMNECGAKRRGWRAAAGATLSLLAVECARLAGGAERRRRSPGLPRPVAAAAALLRENIEGPPSMRDLARAVGLGPTRFHAVFKRAVGLTPRDYLARLRISAARAELAAGAGDITALALRLGYPSGQHFATTFKKHTGLTPSAFRARERKERQKR
ncbi:MAG: helix-turn-helix transcriptional regulator [Planctomycetota bacterium]|jgi:AraC-like DNA-binding protein